MGYKANPFLERMSEQTTSEQEFVRLFSPKVINQLDDSAFGTGISIFTSSPGGGKTTLLRAFTPATLKAFWNTKHWPEPSEAYSIMLDREILDQTRGPELLGVLLTCTSGYADLPRGATGGGEGLFRALLDCRVVLRTLRSLPHLLDEEGDAWINKITISYDELGRELKYIPLTSSCADLLTWAERQERAVHADLDVIVRVKETEFPTNVRFEGVLWLQSVKFVMDGKEIAPKRLLMIDDLQRLRKKQRSLLIDELSEMRPNIPVWLAERRIALVDELLSQGVREGREIRHYSLEEMWTSGRNQQFSLFAQNVLDRRLEAQDAIPRSPFAQYLRDELRDSEGGKTVQTTSAFIHEEIVKHWANARYSEWIARADSLALNPDLRTLRELCGIRILIARDLSKRQLTLDLSPLRSEELDDRDSSSVQAAAELFCSQEASLPYYYGIERLCLAATNNVEELLSIAATLYDGLRAKKLLRRSELVLTPADQDRIFRDVAKRKRDFIPKNHTEGTRAQKLLDAIGGVCREKTYLINAPYAPGVTGLRLSSSELGKLDSLEPSVSKQRAIVKRVLSECVAENLLVMKQSSASVGREGGTVFYLSRALCVHYRLPFQYGGWQDATLEEFIDWTEKGRVGKRNALEGI